jgi:hypothetical protein
MKACDLVGVQFHKFLTSVLAVSEWLDPGFRLITITVRYLDTH